MGLSPRRQHMRKVRCTRRRRATWAGSLLVAVSLSSLVCNAPTIAQQAFTEWGWPLPREQVSTKSIDWLKEKGWWPIQVAYQAPWSGQNTINIVMERQEFLKERGVETKWQAFASGP